MTTSTLARTQFPSAVLVAVGLAAGFGVARAPASARWAGRSPPSLACADVAGVAG